MTISKHLLTQNTSQQNTPQKLYSVRILCKGETQKCNTKCLSDLDYETHGETVIEMKILHLVVILLMMIELRCLECN